MQTVSSDEYNLNQLKKITLNYETMSNPIKNIIIYKSENKIDYVKFITDDKVLLLDMYIDFCYSAFFEIPSVKILKENDLDMKGYVKFKKIIGHKIISIDFECVIDMPYSSEYVYSEINKVYKIILSNNCHSYILLRSNSNGYYEAYLEAYLYSKIES